MSVPSAGMSATLLGESRWSEARTDAIDAKAPEVTSARTAIAKSDLRKSKLLSVAAHRQRFTANVALVVDTHPPRRHVPGRPGQASRVAKMRPLNANQLVSTMLRS